jgi:hypothetical protein
MEKTKTKVTISAKVLRNGQEIDLGEIASTFRGNVVIKKK